ncbi:serine-rich adhesin for platelets-like [Poecilia latipinna]|uniref:serine-rich adhesin for platelets-like n=1 Tax=Poecilia latipinna TaxID=48699 RepID=UPI00072E418F|nr:PREDICTED: serine-rich adhesin for platelets-like [Poecilia latipinna]
MDKQLIFSVLLAMLSWEFIAQSDSSTTVTPGSSSSSTTVTPGSSSSSTTVTPGSSRSSTMIHGSSSTSSHMTPGSQKTTAISGIIPEFKDIISLQECGSSKFCAAEPSECDPTSADCYFLSAKQQSNQTYFELSGQAEGYIAAGLSTTATKNGSYTVYICANHNNTVRFFTAILLNYDNNGELNETTMDYKDQKGSVNSTKIQCTFTAVLPDTSNKAAGVALSILNGTYNIETGVLGKPSFRLLTPLTDLSKFTSISSADPVIHTQSFWSVLLVTMCLLGFTAV